MHKSSATKQIETHVKELAELRILWGLAIKESDWESAKTFRADHAAGCQQLIANANAVVTKCNRRLGFFAKHSADYNNAMAEGKLVSRYAKEAKKYHAQMVSMSLVCMPLEIKMQALFS